MDNNEKKIQATTLGQPSIGIDTKDEFIRELLSGVESSSLDMSTLNSFLNVSQTREQLYALIDEMKQDSTIAAVISCYVSDITNTNDNGEIMWIESNDPHIAKYTQYILDSLNIDKNIQGWADTLVTYGDLFVRLYRQSDFEKDNALFSSSITEQDKLVESLNTTSEKQLNEDINVNYYNAKDPYVFYVESESNPAEFFELTQFGKTMGFIKAPSTALTPMTDTSLLLTSYQVKDTDIEIYSPTTYVHAFVEKNQSRTPEEIVITQGENRQYKYKVKKGQSLLTPVFRVWRELQLLENSVILNRLTKSSITRVVQVEVGNMPKEQVQPKLQSLKKLMEQNMSLNKDKSMGEYTNPGPVENIVYTATHNGQGVISTQQIGGDVDVKSLLDLDYWNDKLFGGLNTLKQFFGKTDDSTGFNGGTSLTILSSRYAKEVKKYQHILSQMVTSIINLFLINKGLTNYINKFTVRMQEPVTQEEIDRRASLSERIRVIGDTLNTLSDIDNKKIRLKIVKSLMSTAITDQEVLQYIQDQIDLEPKDEIEEDIEEVNSDIEHSLPSSEIPEESEEDIEEPESSISSEITALGNEEESEKQDDSYLPNFDELKINYNDVK